MPQNKPPIIPATEALKRLRDGNSRYVNEKAIRPNQCSNRREIVAESQHPFAVIVGCSDSRVPAEIVFDQGIGDLFVIRTAGHRIDDIAIASVEFAVRELGCRLVVVLGHDDCGAVKAALNAPPVIEPWSGDGVVATNHIPRLLAKLQDVVERSRKQPGDLLDNAINENIRTVIKRLLDSSSVLQEAGTLDAMKIAGARYHLATGEIEFLDQ